MDANEQRGIEKLVDAIRYSKSELFDDLDRVFVNYQLEVLRVDDTGNAVDLVIRLPKRRKK